MHDVIIAGGGPAGSALGSLLASAGVDVVLLEKEHHPREHVGESLVTSANLVLGELGVLDWMEEVGFVKKSGASWHPPSGSAEISLNFAELPLPGSDRPYTFHVDRAKFDHHLINRAAELGCDVREGARVRHVDLNPSGAREVHVNGDQKSKLRARVVVDATGRGTLLGNQLGIKRHDPLFDQFAAYTWCENVNRGPDPTSDYIHIYFTPLTRGWVWQIPITDSITSVGVVADKSTYREYGDLSSWFWDGLRSTPDLRTAMHEAKAVRPLLTERDYSYSLDRFSGDGWLLVGDAARFVDPIFSSGVSVALHSAKFAAESILLSLEQGDVSHRAYAAYEDRLRQGVDIWYDFIRLYYKLMNLFTYFVLRRPEHRVQLVRLLQGDVFDRSELDVLKAMRAFVRTVEQTPGHVWQSALTDMPLD